LETVIGYFVTNAAHPHVERRAKGKDKKDKYRTLRHASLRLFAQKPRKTALTVQRISKSRKSQLYSTNKRSQKALNFSKINWLNFGKLLEGRLTR
jgi:hypothetical protein